MLYLVGGPDNAERVDVSELFCRQLAKRGFDVDYVIFSAEPAAAWSRRKWRGSDAYVVGRAARGGVAGAVLNKLRELAADFRVFWLALTGPYDVVQIRDKFVVGVLALVAARVRNKVFTYWLSYPFAECRIVDGKAGLSRFPRISIAGGYCAQWLLYKVIMPRSDHVFVQSEQMKRDVAGNGVPENLMTPVPMAVSETLLERKNVPIKPETMLYLGTLIRIRRLDTLLEALALVMKRFPAARLVFVGDGESPDDRKFLESRAVALGVEKNTEFTGRLPMREAHDRVRETAVCLSPFYPIPILLSTSPTKISEYMALGRPVVANRHPEQSRIIEESGAGICVEWSASDFANAVITLFADPQAAEEMGTAGREYVRRNRVYPVIAPAVAAVYRNLLATRRRATNDLRA